MLEQKILNLKLEALEAVRGAKSPAELESVRVKYLGRKSELGNILRSIGSFPLEEKRALGPLANDVKREIQECVRIREQSLRTESFDALREAVDITIPGKRPSHGHLHPLTIIQNEIEDIFISMGFDVADGPEIETEHYNFDALNVPKDHPARDMQDTFWIQSQGGKAARRSGSDKAERLVLRTQTSAVQVRYMEAHTPPLRVIVPGRIFRSEATDATHEHTFHQFEALMVGDDISVANFTFVAQEFFSRFFGQDVDVRIRPSYFPFTEPSFEFDISCTVCGGKGCPACKGVGWLEIGGAGMVNQNVFVAAGYRRNRYQGFAWGFGMERLAMMKYKINDIRLFHGGDLRFISQF